MGGVDDSLGYLQLAINPLAFFRHVAESQRRPIGEPLEYQSRILWSTSKRIQLIAGRQCGKSTTLASLALWTALFQPGSLVLLIAPTDRQSAILYAKVARLFRAWGGTVDTISARRRGLELANDSQIEALPGNPATIQGYSADLIVLDEAGFCTQELLDAVTPSLAATDGRLVFAGRPNGEWGPLYDVWADGAGWEKHRITAEECPLVSDAFLASERRRMSEREYRSQYLCDFASGSGLSVFGSREQIEAAFLKPSEASPEDLAGFPSEGVLGGEEDEPVEPQPVNPYGILAEYEDLEGLTRAEKQEWSSFYWEFK